MSVLEQKEFSVWERGTPSFGELEPLMVCVDYIQGGPKNGPFLNVDNFAMVSGRKAKVCTFCLQKSVKHA